MTVSIEQEPIGSIFTSRRRALEAFYGAVQAWSDDALEEHLTEDWEDIPLGPDQAPGPSGVKPVFAALRTAFPDIKVRILEVVAAGDKAACRVLISGTHQGDLFGVPASGRVVAFAVHEFHDFEGDRLRRTYHLEDLFGLFSQIGRFPGGDGNGAS